MMNFLARVYNHFSDSLFTRIVPDRLHIRILYRARMKKRLNLKHPQTFNEKLQWLKLYDRNPKYTSLVDKYEVKKYVASRIGEEYIIPTLGVWEKFEDIDFDVLPNQFVLKCTHDSGGLIICKDKTSLDLAAAKKKINKCLKKNYYWHGREWPYKNVKPQIIAEKYMEDESGYELKDYKVMCFGGEAKLIEVHMGRFGSHTQDFYDREWNKLDFLQGTPNSDNFIEKPDCLDKILELSEEFSKELSHVRIDWYLVNKKIYFGEITFFDGSGFEPFTPDEWDYKLGEWIKLSK